MAYKLESKLFNLGDAVEKGIDIVIRKATIDAKAEAKLNAPFQTGATRNAIYSVTDQESDFQQAAIKAQEANPSVQVAEEERLDANHQGKVVAPLHYNIYLELGTARIPAKPFLGPAVLHQEDNVKRGIAHVIEKEGQL